MDKTIKLLLIMPDGKINHIGLLGKKISFREAPLTLTTLAALVPREIPADITLVDCSIGTRVPYHKEWDLVGISLMTGTAMQGYEIARNFRQKEVPVVLGGVHVTLCPQEALAHGDAILTGFCEETWPRLLRDFQKGRMKRQYHSPGSSLDNLPIPRRDLQKNGRYMIPQTVMATRGCKGTCHFCSVPAARFGWNFRPVDQVIDEIDRLPRRRFAISDVHLTQDREYALELFKAMAPLKKKWGALASTTIAQDEELLEWMERAGCSYLLLGFESFNSQSLEGIRKGFNQVEHYKNVVDTLHRFNIVIQGCFIFGFDQDGPEIFQNTLDTINELKIDIPRFALYTPYPGTEAYREMEKQGRLLHKNWYYYDTQHAVFHPKKMSPRQLDRGLLWAYENCFRVKPSWFRARHSGGPGYVTFIGNLAYKLYIQRLKKDRNRFPKELDHALLNQPWRNLHAG